MTPMQEANYNLAFGFLSAEDFSRTISFNVLKKAAEEQKRKRKKLYLKRYWKSKICKNIIDIFLSVIVQYVNLTLKRTDDYD